jgi:hypothetical protein
MILTEKVLIKINGRQVNYYNNLGYNCKNGDLLEICINHLPKGSHTKINVKCDICAKEKELIYKQYNNNISKYSLYSCSEKCGNFKNKLTCKEKYGIETYNNRDGYIETCIKKYGVLPQKLESVKNKTNQTCFEKYGAKFPAGNKEISNKIKNTKINRKLQISDEEKTKFEIYSQKVDNITQKTKKELFKNWNGYDYYDNEYIKENLKLHYNSNCYPSIDHKISKWCGFKENISEEIIGNISNLCITKRIINSLKNKLTENEYRS